MHNRKSSRRLSANKIKSLSDVSLETSLQQPSQGRSSTLSPRVSDSMQSSLSSIPTEKNNRRTRTLPSDNLSAGKEGLATTQRSKSSSSTERLPLEGEGTSYKKLVIVLGICYLVAGTIQTLSLKYTEEISAQGSFSESTCNQLSNDSAVLNSPSEGGSSSFSFIDVLFFFEFSFTHPFAQAFFMFIAESLCLVILFAQRAIQGTVTTARPHHPLVYVVPAAADFFASVIQNVGLFLTYASVYQMLRGATVVWIAVLSRFVFHRHYAKIQKWGIGAVMLGLTLVGMSSLIGRSSSSTGQGEKVEYPHQMIGNLLIISAQFLHAVQGVAEERLLQLYDMPPLQVVGVEGLFGLSFSIILLALLQCYPGTMWGNNVSGLVIQEYGLNATLPSSFPSSEMNASLPLSLLKVTEWNTTSSEMNGFMNILREAPNASRPFPASLFSCSGVPNTTYHKITTGSGDNGDANYFPLVPYDDIHLVFTQMWNNSACLLTVLVYILSGLIYNLSQISIIKLLSAAATVLLGSLRNISVWMMCLALPFFHERINGVQLLGFCFLILGNVLFQRVWYSDFESCLPRAIINACPILFKEG